MSFLIEVLSSALSATVILGIGAWLCRNLILTRLKAAVEYEFNVKFENVRRESKAMEDRFKASLDLKKDAIAALRSDVLSGASSRQSGVHSRRLIAVDALWSIVADSLYPTLQAVQTLSVLNFEEALKAAEKNEQFREYFAKFRDQHDATDSPRQLAMKERPYLSDTAWALFVAYSAIMGHARMRIILLASGVNNPKFIKDDTVKKMIVAALPDHEEYLRDHGAIVHPYLIEVLEQRLLEETRRMLAGKEESGKQIDEAAALLKAAERLYDGQEKNADPIPGPLSHDG